MAAAENGAGAGDECCSDLLFGVWFGLGSLARLGV